MGVGARAVEDPAGLTASVLTIFRVAAPEWVGMIWVLIVGASVGAVVVGFSAGPGRPLGVPSDPVRVDASAVSVEMTAAGGIELDLERQIGKARTDVIVRRGDVTVCCDEARADYRGGRIVRLACRGRVVIRRADGIRATADEAVYVASRDALTLSGRVWLDTKDATLSGTRLVYDIRRDRLHVVGAKSRFAWTPGLSTARRSVRPCPKPRGFGG